MKPILKAMLDASESFASHTPGPWTIDCDLSENGTTLIRDANDEPIANVEFHSDARLIAAAPELLAVLQELAAWEGPQYITSRAMRGFQEAAREAIAKAEGREA